ncbi:MAG: hypothetical protein Hyperionvirus12_4 [Hyperionvirus sp.]|uniref:Sel1 repeat family protein n=1 Tax=Hyperionvirus sp. TaxID=2487770 RepID=A0A3G5A968_9VIRU|nr:MAG: hypothetical protein Hyperionvirus12_4 [Hyperionvirus sp.]
MSAPSVRLDENPVKKKYELVVTKYIKNIMEARKQVADILNGTDEKEGKMLLDAFMIHSGTNCLIQNTIGYMYAEGKGVKQNYEMAFKWFGLSSKKNDPHAQFNLGKMYHRGIGTKIDYGQALRYYSLGLSQGNEKCKIMLSELLDSLSKSNNELMVKIIMDQAARIEQLENESVAKMEPKPFPDWVHF